MITKEQEEIMRPWIEHCVFLFHESFQQMKRAGFSEETSIDFAKMLTMYSMEEALNTNDNGWEFIPQKEIGN